MYGGVYNLMVYTVYAGHCYTHINAEGDFIKYLYWISDEYYD